MLAYCGRPPSASFCDRFPYIGLCYARETIAERCSMWVALATAVINQTGSEGRVPAAKLANFPGGRQSVIIDACRALGLLLQDRSQQFVT
jgi:hypothetical protein